jgi:hypothetical protein
MTTSAEGMVLYDPRSDLAKNADDPMTLIFRYEYRHAHEHRLDPMHGQDFRTTGLPVTGPTPWR